MTLTDAQLDRYARHIILREVGGVGQATLLKSRVLVVGAGGLGSPLILYLAAAGVGKIGVVDADTVSLSNLQRQILHHTDDVGAPKTDSALRAAHQLNPDVEVQVYPVRATAAGAVSLFREYDIVCDGTDNFPTRFLINDAAWFAQRTLVSAAVGQFDGQLAVFKPHVRPGGARTFPCYRCLYPEPPPPGTVPSCTEAGILGALTGVMGSLQAMEVLKELLGIGETMAGRLMLYDGLDARMRTVTVKPDPHCALCGPHPTILDLAQFSDHPEICGVR
jgi:molybdopterin-synthase adenylyltransferase